MTLKTVYVFGGNADHSDPRQKDKTVAGGKGANLAEMAEHRPASASGLHHHHRRMRALSARWRGLLR